MPQIGVEEKVLKANSIEAPVNREMARARSAPPRMGNDSPDGMHATAAV
jgi:hypothetical protein